MSAPIPFSVKTVFGYALIFGLCSTVFSSDRPAGTSARILPLGGSVTNSIFDNKLIFGDKIPQRPLNTTSTNEAAIPQYLSAGELDTEGETPVQFEPASGQGDTLYNILGDPPETNEEFAESQPSSLLALPNTDGATDSAVLSPNLNGGGASSRENDTTNLTPDRALPKTSLTLTGGNATSASDTEADKTGYEAHTSTNLMNWSAF